MRHDRSSVQSRELCCVVCRSVLAIASDLYAAGSVALCPPLSLKGLYTAPRIVVIADVGPGVGPASWASLEWRRLAPRLAGSIHKEPYPLAF